MARKTFDLTLVVVSVIVSVVLLVALLNRIFHEALRDSWDFLVYWNAARSWLFGTQSPYFISSSMNSFVLKYPPWIIPFFAPFALFPEGAAKFLWCLANLIGIGLAQYWLKLQGISFRLILVTTLLFWRFWIVHFNAGQLNLLLLGIVIFAVSSKNRKLRIPLIVLLFTAKIFSAFSLIGIYKKIANKKTLILATLLFSSSTLLVLTVMNLHGPTISPLQLFHDWFRASTSGGVELGERIVRSSYNVGFPALIMRVLSVKANQPWADILAAMGVGIILSLTWFHFSKPLKPAEQWLGWISLGVVVHPLAWHHSFAMIYPLFVIAANKALKSRKALELCWVGVAYLLIDRRYTLFLGGNRDMITETLENASVKSWAVVLLAAYLVYQHRTEQKINRA